MARKRNTISGVIPSAEERRDALRPRLPDPHPRDTNLTVGQVRDKLAGLHENDLTNVERVSVRHATPVSVWLV